MAAEMVLLRATREEAVLFGVDDIEAGERLWLRVTLGCKIKDNQHKLVPSDTTILTILKVFKFASFPLSSAQSSFCCKS